MDFMLAACEWGFDGARKDLLQLPSKCPLSAASVRNGLPDGIKTTEISREIQLQVPEMQAPLVEVLEGLQAQEADPTLSARLGALMAEVGQMQRRLREAEGSMLQDVQRWREELGDDVETQVDESFLDPLRLFVFTVQTKQASMAVLPSFQMLRAHMTAGGGPPPPEPPLISRRPRAASDISVETPRTAGSVATPTGGRALRRRSAPTQGPPQVVPAAGRAL